MRIILLFLVFTLINGCMYPKPKFAKDYNHVRIEVGLQKIPEEWEPSTITDSYTIWINPKADQLLREKKALFFSKTVSYPKSIQTFEEDLYYSGRKFRTVDGYSFESLSVKYYFSSYKKGDSEVNGWQFYYTGPVLQADIQQNNETIFIPEPIKMDIYQVDSTLKNWGISNSLIK